jgi:hypothetical protein
MAAQSRARDLVAWGVRGVLRELVGAGGDCGSPELRCRLHALAAKIDELTGNEITG